MSKVNKILNNVKVFRNESEIKIKEEVNLITIVKFIRIVPFLGFGLILNIRRLSCIPQVRSHNCKINQ